jgi:hypothetical protein
MERLCCRSITMRAFSLALLSTCAVLGPTMARAELPPWAYGEQQRQAPVVLRMAVEQGVNRGGDLHVQGRVLQVIRQPKSGQIKAGQRIWLVYGMPEPRPVAMVGPAPVRRLLSGEKVTAWLQPIPATRSAFSPAAGGKSFGPSMEQAVAPGAP